MPPEPRRVLKLARKTLLGLALLAGLLIAASRPAVLDRAAHWADPGLAARGLAIGWDWSVSAQRLRLSDARGAWLGLRGVRLRWSPLALLSGRIVVDALTARALTLHRLPVAGGAGRAAPSWRVLPRRIALARLAIDRLRLPGGAETYRLTGRASRAGKLASARLALRQIDGPARYMLRARLDPSGLHAGMRILEPSGGPLQRRAGIATTGIATTGIATTGLAPAPLHLRLRAEGPLAALRLMGRLTRAPLAIRLHGRLDLPARTGRGALTARLAGPLRLAGLDLAGGRLAARVAGPFAALSGRARLRLDGLVAGAARLARLDATARLAAGAVALRARFSGPYVPGLALGTPRLIARLTPPPARRLRFRLITALGTLRGIANPATTSLRARLSLPRLAALTGQAVHGAAALRLGAMRAGGAIRLRLAGTARLTAPAALAALASPALRIALRGRVQGGTLFVSVARLDSAVLGLRARGRARASRIAARFRLRLPDLAALARVGAASAPPLTGAMRVTGHLAGPPDAIALDASLIGALHPPGAARTRSAFHARLALIGLPSAPHGTLQAGGSLLGAPLTLAVALAPGPRLTLARAAWRSFAAHGALRFGPPRLGLARLGPPRLGPPRLGLPRLGPPRLGLPWGKLTLRFGHLSDLAPLLGQGLGGRLMLRLAATGPTGHLTASARHWHVGTARLAAATLTARLTAPKPADRGQPDLAATLALTGLRAAGIAGSARLDATGPVTSPALRLAARLTPPGGGVAALSASARADIPARVLVLTALAGHWLGLGLRLRAPLRLAPGPNGIAFAPLRADLAGGSLTAQGRIGRTLALRARLGRLPAAAADAFLPGLHAAGTLTATADLTGPAAAPNGTVTLAAQGLRLRTGPARALPPANLSARLRLAGPRRAIHARVEAGGSLLALDGTVIGTKLALALTGALDAALANPLIEARGAHLAGRLGLRARIGGSLAAPRLGGQVTLADGSFAAILPHGAGGVHLRAIAGRIVAAGNVLRIAGLRAQAGAGWVALGGTLGLGPDLPAALRLTAHDATLLSGGLVTEALDAALTLDGRLRPMQPLGAPAQLAGTIDVRNATLRIPDALPPQVRTIPVRWAGAAPAPARQPAPPIILPGLALRIVAPRRIFVRGRGLQAEFGGTVTLGGSLAAPIARGGFRLIRGSLALAGQSLRFTSGAVRFTGAGLADPALELKARAVTGDTVATLAVTGSVAAPHIALSSVPALPSDQVLARLLFGGGASQLSPLQIASLANGLAQLSGAGAALPDPVGTLRRALGLSTLGMGAGGSSVRAGRYIGGVYVGAEQSTTGGGTRGTVRYDLTRHLRVHAAIGAGEASSALGASGVSGGESVGIGYHLAY